MCCLCDEDDELFDHACCEECGEAVCFDVAPDDAIDAGETAKSLLTLTDQQCLLRKAVRWRYGLFCVTCADSFPLPIID